MSGLVNLELMQSSSVLLQKVLRHVVHDVLLEAGVKGGEADQLLQKAGLVNDLLRQLVDLVDAHNPDSTTRLVQPLVGVVVGKHGRREPTCSPIYTRCHQPFETAGNREAWKQMLRVISTKST